MEDHTDRYGTHFRTLKDSQATGKEFEFDLTLLTPTARGYRDLVEQARIEINPRILNYLKTKWSEGTIENLSSFAMAAAVYSRSVSDPPCMIDIGKVLLRTVAFCNLRCASRVETGGGCRAAMNKGVHTLPRCIKMPRDLKIIWEFLRIYIATGKAANAKDVTDAGKSKNLYDAMRVKIELDIDFSPVASC
ncbi:MAG: hypothetical protein EHM14_13545 [Methanothrix sp.]|nr:MAG: hypothetical protein EHM14_13545 [Methanothrix sp.]